MEPTFFDRSLSNIYYHFAFYGALHELNSNENEQMKILSCPQQCHAKYITLVLHCHACGGVLLFLMLCSRVIEYASGFLICQFCAKIVCHCKPHVFFPQLELELPDEENDDVKDEARDNELDASESARTSCSGFISMSRRGGRRRCQR